MHVDDLVALPILSVRQPWAAFIVSGIKRVELRSWQTDYRGWLWIHAGKQPDADAFEILGLATADFKAGGLLGLARLSACTLIDSPNRWYALRNDHRSPGAFTAGTFAWTFSDAIALAAPLSCRGELRLFSLDDAAQQRIAAQLHDHVHDEFLQAVSNL